MSQKSQHRHFELDESCFHKLRQPVHWCTGVEIDKYYLGHKVGQILEILEHLKKKIKQLTKCCQRALANPRTFSPSTLFLLEKSNNFVLLLCLFVFVA